MLRYEGDMRNKTAINLDDNAKVSLGVRVLRGLEQENLVKNSVEKEALEGIGYFAIVSLYQTLQCCFYGWSWSS